MGATPLTAHVHKFSGFILSDLNVLQGLQTDLKWVDKVSDG